MYVLMDLEWVKDENGAFIPTQIAALRTDGEWRGQDLFFARFRIDGENFGQWGHLALSGGRPEDFMDADRPEDIWLRLDVWFREDDILCWWGDQAPQVFRRLYAPGQNAPDTDTGAPPHRFLPPMRVFPRWGITLNSPYRLADIRKLSVPLPAHCSENDVLAMQTVLRAISYNPNRLFMPGDKKPKKKQPPKAPPPPPDIPYRWDRQNALVHKKDCKKIPEGAVLTELKDLKPCFKQEARPCPDCLGEEYRQIKRERTRDMINRSTFQFIFTKDSQVFHRRECALMLSANAILGSSYKGCVKSGRRPCKICKPEPPAPPPPPPPPPKKQKESYPPLSASHQKAVDRLYQAQKERRRAEFSQMSEQELQDHLTLTKPGNVFWAAVGHQTFHRRDCPKLNGLSDLKGFSKFKAAVRAGHTPCRVCKPDKKMDAEYSIPITSRRRKGESPRDLVNLCKANNYIYIRADNYFIIKTPVGRWRVHLNTRPVVLDHVNLTMTRDDPALFHRQPRLFLSLADTFAYIKRHDTNLEGGIKTQPQPEGETENSENLENSDGALPGPPLGHLGANNEKNE